MKKMIDGYKTSCRLVEERLKELKNRRKMMLEKEEISIMEEFDDLDRRIRLLDTEYKEMQEIISHLKSYMRKLV